MKLQPKELVKERLEIAKEAQREIFEKFNRFDDLFASKTNSAYTLPSGSKVFVPYSWSTIETIVPRMLGNKPTINYFPREQSDVDQAKILTELFQYWWDKTGAFRLFTDAIKNALIYGTAILRTSWKYRPSYRKIRKNGQVYNIEATPYDEPEVQLVNNYDFYVDPSATCIEDADWVIHRIYRTIEDLEAHNDEIKDFKDDLLLKGYTKEANKLVPYKYIQKLKTSTSSTAERTTFEDARKSAADTKYPQDKTKNEIEILEMWTADGKVYDYAPDHDLILRERNNPYWHGKLPFIVFNDSRVPLEFWGKGEIEPIEKIQHAMNTVVNQRIDNVSAVLNPMWKAKGEVDDTELAWFQGNIIHVDEFADAEMVRMPDVTKSAYTEFQALRDISQETLGVTDYIKGTTSQDEPLGATQIKTAQSNARFSHKIQLFEEMCLKELGYHILSLYQQYITTEKVIRIVGIDGVKYKTLLPEDIQGEYDVVPEQRSTEPINEDLNRQQFLQLYQLFVNDESVNQFELKKRLFEKFGIKDADDLLMQDRYQMGIDQMAGYQGEQLPSEQQIELPAEPLPAEQPEMIGQPII